jgi:hypothetical protein
VRDTGQRLPTPLTDAAVVLSKVMDSNAEEHELQEVTAGEPSCDIQGPSVLEALAADIVNNPALPERSGLEADNKKVPTHTRTLRHAPRAASFIFWRHPS